MTELAVGSDSRSMGRAARGGPPDLRVSRPRGTRYPLQNRLKFPSKPPPKRQRLRETPFGAVLEPAPFQTSDEDSRDNRRAGHERCGAAGGGSDQGNHDPDLREGRHRGIEAPAGADRLLGAMVWPMPPAHAGAGEGSARRQGPG